MIDVGSNLHRRLPCPWFLPKTPQKMNLSPEDRAELEEAVRSLEKPAFVPKLIDIIGLPLDKAMAALPHNWKHVVQGATHKALVAALELAMLTMQSPRTKPASNFLHKLFVAASGAGGGALGLVSLPVELPFSTCLILRSVADIARSEGEEIRSVPAKLACLEVLALGGRTASDDGIQVGYFALRSVLAHEVSEAAKFIAQRGLVEVLRPLPDSSRPSPPDSGPSCRRKWRPSRCRSSARSAAH